MSLSRRVAALSHRYCGFQFAALQLRLLQMYVILLILVADEFQNIASGNQSQPGLKSERASVEFRILDGYF